MTQISIPGAEAAHTIPSVPAMHHAYSHGAHWACRWSLHTGFLGSITWRDQVQDDGCSWVKTRESRNMNKKKNAEKAKDTGNKHGLSPTCQWEVFIHHSQEVRRERPSAPRKGLTAAPRSPSGNPPEAFRSQMSQMGCTPSMKNAKNRKVTKLAVKLKWDWKVQKAILYSS